MPRRANAPTVAQQRQRIERLHAVNRTRSLTQDESAELQRLIERQNNRRAVDRYRLPFQIKAAKARLELLERRTRELEDL